MGADVVARYSKKVCLLGDEGVGKTSLIRRFVENTFDDSYIKTIGTKISKKELIIQDRSGQPVQLTFMIWDIMGHKSSKRVPATYYAGVEGILAVVDVTRPETFKDIDVWVNTVVMEKNYAPAVVLLGNKSDLRDQVKITDGDMSAAAGKMSAAHFWTSAKTGENVEEAFHRLGKEMLFRQSGPGWGWA
ncbi:MAG: Rab family GTPase [Thermoplasmatota archaeon]